MCTLESLVHRMFTLLLGKLSGHSSSWGFLCQIEHFLFPATFSWGWTELKTDAGFSWFFCCMMHTDTGKKGKWGECEMRCAKTGCQLFTQKCRERKRSWKPKMWKMAHTAFLFCSWWPHYCGWRWKCPNRAFILPHTPCSPLMEHTCCRKVQLLTLCS